MQGPPYEKFRVHSVLLMKKFQKIFDLKFGMTKKSCTLDLHSEKFRVQSTL